MEKDSIVTAPPSGWQRLRRGQIVRSLFGSLPREERKNAWRKVCSFIRKGELLARPADSTKRTYDVNIQSLEARRQTLKASEPWLVVSRRDESITLFGERIELQGHQFHYVSALAKIAGKLGTCKEIANLADRSASDPVSLGPILCRIRCQLRPAVEKHSAELIGVSKREIELALIVCSQGSVYKDRPTRYKLVIDPARVRFLD